MSNRFGKEVTNRLEGQPTGLSSRINLQGYYVTTYKIWFNGDLSPDTTNTSVLFYEDGTFVSNFFSPNEDPGGILHEAVVAGRKSKFYIYHSWGVYVISGDTIKAQYAWYPYQFVSPVAGEQWYLIRPDHTIQLINGYVHKDPPKPVKVNNNSALWPSIPPRSEMPAAPAIFVPVRNVPPSLPWLKEREFFWRNESDWKRYMLENKISKKDIL